MRGDEYLGRIINVGNRCGSEEKEDGVFIRFEVVGDLMGVWKGGSMMVM